MNQAINRSLAATHRTILRAHADKTLRPHERKRAIAEAEARLKYLQANFTAKASTRRGYGAFTWTC